MIVDTSALVAMLWQEPGASDIDQALVDFDNVIIAPVIVELHRVTSLANNVPDPDALMLVKRLQAIRTQIVPFDLAGADLAVLANQNYGSGNGKGGTLNMLDLMVYAAAKVRNLPILCTGFDFATTDALIHPASRIG